MTTLNVDDLVLDPAEYEPQRPARRRRMIETRRRRRVPLGDLLAVEFENAETLRYQAQEMLFVERVTSPAVAAAEIEPYGRLLPDDHTLSATLFVEIDDVEHVKPTLARLDGVPDHVRLEIGDAAVSGEDVPPPDEGPRSIATYAVHFLRFRLDDAQRAALADLSVPVRLVVEHPQLTASTPLEAGTRAELAADLGY